MVSLTVPIEAVLTIDVSESMKSALDSGYAWTNPPTNVVIYSRMTILKRAASNLVDILDPNEENLVAISVVPWQIVVRLDEAARQNWAANGWAGYPTDRHYDAAYACKTQRNRTATAQDDTCRPIRERSERAASTSTGSTASGTRTFWPHWTTPTALMSSSTTSMRKVLRWRSQTSRSS